MMTVSDQALARGGLDERIGIALVLARPGQLQQRLGLSGNVGGGGLRVGQELSNVVGQYGRKGAESFSRTPLDRSPGSAFATSCDRTLPLW